MSDIVLDIGTKNLCISAFGREMTSNTPVLLSAGVYDIEQKSNNNNLITRLIQRELLKLAEDFEIDNLIILPRRQHVVHHVVKLEYNSNAQRMKRDLINSIQLSNPSQYITDWTVEDDNPEQDYQSIFASSIRVSEFKFASEIAKALGIHKYKIASPSGNLGMLLPHDNKPYLLMQIGHSNTELYIIRNNICERYAPSTTFTSAVIGRSIQANSEMTQKEIDAFKVNATALDLETYLGTSELADFLLMVAKSFCEEYREATGLTVAGYAVAGGIANLDFESWAPTIDFDLPRIFLKLPVANHRQVPAMVRNYLLESACIMYDSAQGTDFSMPKDKSLGKYVGMFTHVFEVLRTPAYVGLLAIPVSTGMNYAQNYFLSDKVIEDTNVVTAYQSEVSALQSNINTLQAQYNELLDDKQLSIVNYGDTLNTLGQLIPNGTFITEIRDVTEQYLPSANLSGVTNQPQPQLAVTPQTAPQPQVQTQPQPQLDPQTPVEPNSATQATQSTQDTQVAQTPQPDTAMNGLEYSSSDLLVALEIQGYTNVRYKCYDYALLLKQTYADAVVVDVQTEDSTFKFVIHVLINK